jgi:hypothetical protein
MRLVNISCFVAGMAITMASAGWADSHTSHGAACDGATEADRKALIRGPKGVANDDPVNAHTVVCPVVYGDQDFDVSRILAFVHDRNPDQPLSCISEVVDQNGTNHFSPTRFACGADNLKGCATESLFFDTSGFRYRMFVEAFDDIPNGQQIGLVNLRCSLPAKANGLLSHIDGFSNQD